MPDAKICLGPRSLWIVISSSHLPLLSDFLCKSLSFSSFKIKISSNTGLLFWFSFVFLQQIEPSHTSSSRSLQLGLSVLFSSCLWLVTFRSHHPKGLRKKGGDVFYDPYSQEYLVCSGSWFAYTMLNHWTLSCTWHCRMFGIMLLLLIYSLLYPSTAKLECIYWFLDSI